MLLGEAVELLLFQGLVPVEKPLLLLLWFGDVDQTVSLLEVLVLWEIVPVLLVLLSLILAGVVSHTVPFEVLFVSAVLLLVWNVDLQVFVGEVPLWVVFLLLLSVKVVKLMLFGVVFPAVFVLLSLLCGEFVDLEVF